MALAWILFLGLAGGSLAATPGSVSAPAFQDNLAQRLRVCVTCHGEQGRAGPDGYYPRIAGKPAGYLYNQLRYFQNGQRRHNLMTRLVANLSDAYLMEVAQYFSALDLPYAAPLPPKAPDALLARGRQLALAGDPALAVPACTSCHGKTLTGALPATPGLLGLPGDYLGAQLGAWQTGARAAHAPDCMAQTARRLRPGDVAALSAWLSSQAMPARATPAVASTHPDIACGSQQPVALSSATPAPTPESPGRYLAVLGNCQACHTRAGGVPFAGGRGIATPFGTVYSSNLTPAASGLRAWTADDFWRAMHQGQSRDGHVLNPAFPYANFRRISRADSDALYRFFMGLQPVEAAVPAHALRWPLNTQLALRAWRWLYAPAPKAASDSSQLPAGKEEGDAQWQRGAYLVEGLGHCSACHMPRNALGGNTDMFSLAGGFMAGQSWYAASLLDPAEGGVQDKPAAEVVQLLQSGRGGNARTSGPMAEVVRHSRQHWKPQDMADCHGAKGQGVRASDGNWAYPPLLGNRTVLQSVPVNLVQTVLYGGFGPSTTGNPRPFGMPPYVLELSEQDVSDVLSFIRSAWGNRAAPVSALEVQRLRNGAAQ